MNKNKLVYIFVVPFLYLLSILPFFILYILSDIMYLIVYYIIGYRKKVVHLNLQSAFPEKSNSEIIIIQKKYFKYLCDLVVETFKTITISPKRMLRHCNMNEASKSLFEKLRTENKSALIVLGHHGNWEWGGNTISLICKQNLQVIYHPITNPYFDRFMMRLRTRFGATVVAMKDTFRKMLATSDSTTLTAFVADQSPSPQHAYWLEFLHQDTPVFEGVEKMAKKLNRTTVYLEINKIKRGYYCLNAELLDTDPTITGYGEITKKHINKLESVIQNQPETWLWSHRRWKHKKPDNIVVAR